ncbi:MAG: cupin domain-containing protein [Thermodesulfobacteriota bacterium]
MSQDPKAGPRPGKSRAMGGNLQTRVPPPSPEESVEILAETGSVRIERITSHGQASPPGFWYDQEEDEWVAVLSGNAGLRFQDGDRLLALHPGDWVFLPAGTRHRVDYTAPDQPTVWLAVFSDGKNKG